MQTAVVVTLLAYVLHNEGQVMHDPALPQGLAGLAGIVILEFGERAEGDWRLPFSP